VLEVPGVDQAATLTLTGVFDPPADVETGVGYALVVSVNAGSFIIRARSGNACPDQKFFTGASGSGPFEENSNDMIFSATILV
jgi:hypothetical protein